ncbi:hypothetical protein [Escherichia coli]
MCSLFLRIVSAGWCD